MKSDQAQRQGIRASCYFLMYSHLAHFSQTHPGFSVFMSSVDLHTQYPLQQMLPESISVVVSPGMVVISQFNGTSTPKGSYSAKTGDNDCSVNSSRYSLRTALCESIRYQAKSEQNVRQDLMPRVHHGEAALCTLTMCKIRVPQANS